MNYFRFSKNDDAKFVLTENDFALICEQYQTQILDRIGINGKLPEKVDEVDFMNLPYVDELLENYFTYKFLAREYNLETKEEMEEIARFIADLIHLSHPPQK